VTPTYAYVPPQPYAPAPVTGAPPAQAYAALPVPTYTAGTVAVPAPPTYDPTAAAQFSGPPISAYAYGIPGAVIAPPAARPNRTALIVMSVVLVLLVGATGLMSTLFVLQKNQTSKANDQTNSLSSQLAQQKAASDKALADAQSNLKDAQDSADQANQDKQVMVDCLKALITASRALQATGGKTTPANQSLVDDANLKCAKAQALL
jgi:hypothetical protein